MRSVDAELAAMVRAAAAAGAALLADFRQLPNVVVEDKGPADFVSSADVGSQRIIAALLGRACPGIAILGEEDRGPGAGVDGLRFVVDPLDGTTNFLHGIPHFAISIALEEDGEVLAGVVLDPCRNELFHATRGGGSFLDGVRVLASTRRELTDAVVATGIPHRARGDHAAYLRALAAVMNEAAGIRRFGAAALDLAYVAAGRFDAFFELGLARWDLSAGALLVSEAGGRVTEPGGHGDPLASGDVLATNGGLHDALRALLQGC